MDTHSGLEILLRTWMETFDVLQGYHEIRLSVVALSRVFECSVDDVLVKGGQIVPLGKIVTRSQRSQGEFWVWCGVVINGSSLDVGPCQTQDFEAVYQGVVEY